MLPAIPHAVKEVLRARSRRVDARSGGPARTGALDRRERFL